MTVKKFKTSLLCAAILLSAFIFQHCDDETPVVATHIYLAGDLNGTGVYWIDGIVHPLPGNTEANSIFVYDGDVYVAGYEYDASGNNPQARCWKNGISMPLQLGSYPSSGESVIVVNGVVYVAGYEYEINSEGIGKEVAKYWVDGVPVSLSDGTQRAYAFDIAISQHDDVYVTGMEVSGSQFAAKYWLNGTPTILSSDLTKHSTATSIAVSGDNVLVGGFEESGESQYSTIGYATYWMDGTYFHKTDGSDMATIGSVVIDGADIYACGHERIENDHNVLTGVAKYWKNGNEVVLTNGELYASSYSMFVFDGDVYVAGREKKSGSENQWIAKYWKNGDPVPVSGDSDDSIIRSIFVTN